MTPAATRPVAHPRRAGVDGVSAARLHGSSGRGVHLHRRPTTARPFLHVATSTMVLPVADRLLRHAPDPGTSRATRCPYTGRRRPRALPEIGYAIASEEHGPHAIVQHARLVEATGVPFAISSDHVHPWTTTH